MFLVPCCVNVEVVMFESLQILFRQVSREIISPVILHLASTSLIQLQQRQQPLVCKKQKCYLLLLTVARLGSSQSKQMFSLGKNHNFYLFSSLGLQFKKNPQNKQNLHPFLLTSNTNNKVRL